MAWSKQQKATAAIACKAAGISDEQRRDVILRNFPNARQGDRVTSTSPKLNAADFEQFMAVVEGFAGGTLPTFARGYWHKAAGDRTARLIHRVRRVDAAMRAAGVFNADSLRKWIDGKVNDAAGLELEQLDYHRVLGVMLGLMSFAKQKGVSLDAHADELAGDGQTTASGTDAAANASTSTEGLTADAAR